MTSEVFAALVGVAYLSLVAVALLLVRRASASARAALVAETLADERELAPGFAVVHGEVETEGARPAVVVRIYQLGREFNSETGLRHGWTEFGRQVDSPPFFLRLASGQRVQVVPGESVRLVDELATEPLVVPHGEAPQRLRTARLSPGDSAYVCGTLEEPASVAAYRGGEEAWTLRSIAGRQMVVSPRPLSPFYTRRARFHMAWAVACAALLLVANGCFFGAYWLELCGGRPAAASALGTRPTVEPLSVFLALLVFGVAASIYRVHATRMPPWYDRRQLVDAGKGPLGSPDAPV